MDNLQPANPNLPVVLTIAGSDSSAGAGAQADLKTFQALGVYGLTAITCVVAEVPGKVTAIQPVAPEIVADQIRVLFGAFPIAAVKTGMLFSGGIIEQVCTALEQGFATMDRRPFLVVDPVMVATSGDRLLQDEAVGWYRDRLIPMADLVTPNLDEVRTLLGRPVTSLAEMRRAGDELARAFGVSFLIKGGHLREPIATDLLFANGTVQEFGAPFVRDVFTHGTGCTYAAAIAAGVARGLPLAEAVGRAKIFLTSAIARILRWERSGRRTDALHHFATFDYAPAPAARS